EPEEVRVERGEDEERRDERSDDDQRNGQNSSGGLRRGRCRRRGRGHPPILCATGYARAGCQCAVAVHAGSAAVSPSAAITSSASSDSCRDDVLMTCSPSGMWPTTSSKFVDGARTYVAPASRAPYSFCRMPPMGPTSPVASMVPVPAIAWLPVSSPGVSVT